MIKAFKGLRPTKKHVTDVIAPPYDVLNRAEAKQRANGKPLSFLHISKPEIDLPDDVDAYDDSVYQKGRENFQAMLAQNVLTQDSSDCFYIYRQIMDGHTQTGLVTLVSTKDYLDGNVKKHEHTRPKKVNDRVNQIVALQAQTGPVMLTYCDNDTLTKLLNDMTDKEPQYDVVADDNVRHQFWVVEDTDTIFSAAKNIDALYIADGHHRSEAAAKADCNYCLAVIFPANELNILSYNRVIKDLNGLSENELIEKLKTHFKVSNVTKKTAVKKRQRFAMYLNKNWYLLEALHPTDALDVALITDSIIEPIFNITDQRNDERIDFVGGIRGLEELERRVDSGDMAIAFAMFPTAIEEIIALADKNEVTPPKSTWFEPKLADGLISYLL